MLGQSCGTGFIPSNFDVFAGLDVDKRSIAATFTDHQDRVRSVKMPYSAEHLLGYVRRHFPNQRVAFAYEAGPTGRGLHDELAAQATCLVVSPSMVPTPPGQRVKTNRLDSVKLASLLKGGQLHGIHVPSETYRQLRHLTQLRDTLTRQAVATQCRIKAMLLLEGLTFPPAPPGSEWGLRTIAQLESLTCNGAVRFKLDQLLSTLSFTRKQLLAAQREIRRFCRQDAELKSCIEYLTSIPGIGWITASHLLARIGDWRNLRNVRQLGSFLGVVPSEHSTGDDINRGRITRSGDGRLRAKLVQCAWAAVRQDPELDAFFARVRLTNSRQYAAQKAIVAVANKLARRIFAVLTEQRPYEVRPPANTDLASKGRDTPQGTPRYVSRAPEVQLPEQTRK